MKLADYLAEKRMSAAEFAAQIGLHKSTVSRWIDSDSTMDKTFRPSWENIEEVKRATGGAVTADDWVTPAGPAQAAE